jgi:hypothetical protein
VTSIAGSERLRSSDIPDHKSFVITFVSQARKMTPAEEVNTLIDASVARSQAFGMFVIIAAVTGCRRGEIAGLRWTDLDDDVLTVRTSVYSVGSSRGIKSTKTGRARRLLIGPELGKELANWRVRCEIVAKEFGVTYPRDAFLFSSRPDGASPVIGGEPGSGKSVVLSSIVAAGALDPAATLTLLDGKQVELAIWRPVVERFVGPDLAGAGRRHERRDLHGCELAESFGLT